MDTVPDSHGPRSLVDSGLDNILIDDLPHVLRLNVGGTEFRTTLNTLKRHPESMLAKMLCTGLGVIRDPTDGSFFIDRSDQYFPHMLRYMREGLFPLDTDDLHEIALDADFYGLDVLAEHCRDGLHSFKNIQGQLTVPTATQLEEEFVQTIINGWDGFEELVTQITSHLKRDFERRLKKHEESKELSKSLGGIVDGLMHPEKKKPYEIWARCLHQVAHQGNYFTNEPSTSWLGIRQQQVLVTELQWTDIQGVSSKLRLRALTYFLEVKLGMEVEHLYVKDPEQLLLQVSIPVRKKAS